VTNEWRRIVAALDNPYRRAVYAEAVLGLPGEPTAKRERAMSALRGAGLVDASGAAITGVFAQLLAEHPPVTRSGVDRWVRDGMIHSYPAKSADRDELLKWAAGHIPGGQLTEAEVGEHLAAVTTDVATLRRYLVDAGLLHRNADGTSYTRA